MSHPEGEDEDDDDEMDTGIIVVLFTLSLTAKKLLVKSEL